MTFETFASIAYDRYDYRVSKAFFKQAEARLGIGVN
jgi:hypothetical protein